jgi:hypothetical protein
MASLPVLGGGRIVKVFSTGLLTSIAYVYSSSNSSEFDDG